MSGIILDITKIFLPDFYLYWVGGKNVIKVSIEGVRHYGDCKLSLVLSDIPTWHDATLRDTSIVFESKNVFLTFEEAKEEALKNFNADLENLR